MVISGHKWSTTHRVLKSHRSKMSVIYVIMKTMCPPGYHHNGFVATHALGHMMYGLYIYAVYIYVYIYIRFIYKRFIYIYKYIWAICRISRVKSVHCDVLIVMSDDRKHTWNLNLKYIVYIYILYIILYYIHKQVGKYVDVGT